MSRKKGAQPANTNALKHGFYSPRFTITELSDLETLLHADGLDDEINLMRVQIRRLQQIANDDEDKQDLMDTLNTMGSASTRLAGMLRTNQALAHRQTDVAALLTQAIQEVFGSELDPRNP